MKFSVIIPNYNHAAFLEERIGSVLKQTHEDFELIILDDASTDNSRGIIEKYRSHAKVTQIVYNDANSGSPFRQWVRGMQLAKNEWIWIAESDDHCGDGFLAAMAAAFADCPNAGLCYSDARIFDQRSGKSSGLFSERKNKLFDTNRWSLNHCSNGFTEADQFLKWDCTVNNISSTVFQKHQAAPFFTELEKFRYVGDWYLLLQLALHTDIAYSAEPLNTYRRHPESASNSEDEVVQKKMEYFRLLQLLLQQERITGKKDLIRHWTTLYLGIGFFSDGPFNSIRSLFQFFREDAYLATAILREWIRSRLQPTKTRFHEAG